MDVRVRKNLHSAQEAQAKLDALDVHGEELAGLSKDARSFYFCVLSQMNVVEVMTNDSDVTDCVGFGLAIKRPEHVLDDPTAVS